MKYLLLVLMSLFLVGCAGPGAIGVAYNQDGIVRHVFRNSPAHKAGIQVGDKIKNRKDLRGEVGTMCLVKIEREGTYMELLLERVDVDDLDHKVYDTWPGADK